MARKISKKDKINSILDKIRFKSSGYIIVQDIAFELLLSNASDQTLGAVERVINGTLPNVKALDSKSDNLNIEVRSLREQNSISQTELANRAGLKQPDVSDFEKNNPKSFGIDRRVRVIEALAKIIKEKSNTGIASSP